MRFTSDFWIKMEDASDITAGTLDGMATDSNYLLLQNFPGLKDLFFGLISSSSCSYFIDIAKDNTACPIKIEKVD